MKKQHTWCWIVVTGAMLLIAALFLVLHNLHEDEKSGEAAGIILTELQQEIAARPTEPEPTIPVNDLYAEYETQPSIVSTDPSLELDGSVYVGIISIPELDVELPVMQNWSYPNLKTAPCVYSGAAASGDLIIAAHNYKSHFGQISSLYSGSLIRFTDISGRVYEYEVVQTDTVGGYDAPSMRNGGGTDWNLTLFTCTLSGRSRVSVRAVCVSEG